MILLALAIAACPEHGRRVTCVHDGDTGHFEGVKWRAFDYDTPELDSTCEAERRLAIRARDRLIEMLNSGEVTYTTHGYDRMQKPRLLVTLFVDGKAVQPVLVAEGLAHEWHGKRLPWC